MGHVEYLPNLLPASRKALGVLDVFATTIPILQTSSISRTINFYTNHLSFGVCDYDGYLIFTRDKMEIHYEFINNVADFFVQNCYIRGRQASFLFEEFKSRKIPGMSDLASGRWDMKEFTIKDPDGNSLRFAYTS